jgi:hypothetical protein
MRHFLGRTNRDQRPETQLRWGWFGVYRGSGQATVSEWMNGVDSSAPLNTKKGASEEG